MVALTSGMAAADIGINRADCAQDMARSYQKEQKLKQSDSKM